MAEPLDYLDALARYLDERSLLTYDPTGVCGDTFVETLPPAPDEAVCLSLYGAGAVDARNGWDERSLQVRVRGTADPRPSRRRAEALYSALHGLARCELPGGIWLVLAVAVATPAPMGSDANGRHEHVTNYRLTIEAPTSYRVS
ncbi:minor capsid protein [Streptomyces nigrescens]|uniref:minor capsid protein n=1 Tax=Streptomyces nigrescens TaxID=1920 RepID=UPI0022567EAF|nr:minor capsid protein [Streptomyces libani]MCX5446005.1 minor capsid protein [Streptomyces libani]